MIIKNIVLNTSTVFIIEQKLLLISLELSSWDTLYVYFLPYMFNYVKSRVKMH